MNFLAHGLAKILVPLFFLGMIGSLCVVLLTVVRDLRQVLPKDADRGGTDL